MPSSVIYGMLYSPAQQTLDIVFRGDRGTYRYTGVTREEWRAFKRSSSKGTYLNSTFKARHPHPERFGEGGAPFIGSLAASVLHAGRDLPDENLWGFFDNALI